LRGLVGSPRRSVVFFSLRGLAFPSICPRSIELLKKCGEVLKRGQFVEAKELFLLDLFVAECIFTDCRFEERESIEEVYLSSCVVDTELKMFLQAGFEVI
jgi:hypothetical protein